MPAMPVTCHPRNEIDVGGAGCPVCCGGELLPLLKVTSVPLFATHLEPQLVPGQPEVWHELAAAAQGAICWPERPRNEQVVEEQCPLGV